MMKKASVSSEKFSEADLCNEFKSWASNRGFLIYPEVGHWDQVLVRSDRCEAYPEVGTDQIGIQAKLQANIKVLSQSLGPYGPFYRYVLVPRAAPEFIDVCRHLGLGVFFKEKKEKVWGVSSWVSCFDGFYSLPAKRMTLALNLELPPVIPNLPAGVASPKQLTKWRVGALKVCNLLETKGFLTSADFAELGVSMGIWKKMRWIVFSGQKTGHMKHYVRGPGDKWPADGWEGITEQLRSSGELI